jgi:hypothetical protein
MSNSEMIEKVEALELQRRNALIGDDIDKLAPLLSAEFIYVHATGVTTEKTDYVNFCRSGAAKYLSIEADRVETCACGEDAVVMRGRMFTEVIHNGQPRTIRNRFVGFWRREAGHVRLLHWQLTAIASAS